jgi:hypothetical protein
VGTNEWVCYGLMPPELLNTNPTADAAWKVLPIHSVTAGVVRACRFQTVNNGRITEYINNAAAAWSLAAVTASGPASGHVERWTGHAAADVDYALCTLPAGYDTIAIRHNPRPTPGKDVTVLLSVGTPASPGVYNAIGTFTPPTYATAGRIGDYVVTVDPTDADRSIKISLGSDGAKSFFLIAVLTFDTDREADPTEVNIDGYIEGNRHFALYHDGTSIQYSVAGSGTNTHSHIPTTYSRGCYRLVKPNVIHTTANQNNGSGVARWTGDGFHFVVADNNELTLSITPVITTDGAAYPDPLTDPGSGGPAYDSIIEADEIVVTYSGTCGPAGAGVTEVSYTYTYTSSGVATTSTITWQSASPAYTIYLPSWSLGTSGSADLLLALTGYVKLSGDTTHYTIGEETKAVTSKSAYFYPDDCPYVVNLKSDHDNTEFYTQSDADKIYMRLNGSDFAPVGVGVAWELGGSFEIKSLSTAFLSFSVQPQDTLKNRTLPTVTVTVYDEYGNISDSIGSTTAVTMSMSGIGTLTGTLIKEIVDGIATFDDLKIDGFGTHHLIATVGSTSATSNSFDIIGQVQYEEFAAVSNQTFKNNEVKLVSDTDYTDSMIWQIRSEDQTSKEAQTISIPNVINGNLLSYGTNYINLWIDRTKNYYIRTNVDNAGWSDWNYLDLTGEIRVVGGKHRDNTTVTKTSKGATVRTSNPQWTETKTSRGATIHNNTYNREQSRSDY